MRMWTHLCIKQKPWATWSLGAQFVLPLLYIHRTNSWILQVLSVPPPSKHAWTSTAQHQGSGANKKYINTDLPDGATNNNVWCHIFISTVAHLAGTYENAWSIPNDTLQAALQKIWNIVYRNSLPHTVAIGGPVYYIVSQFVFD